MSDGSAIGMAFAVCMWQELDEEHIGTQNYPECRKCGSASGARCVLWLTCVCHAHCQWYIVISIYAHWYACMITNQCLWYTWIKGWLSSVLGGMAVRCGRCSGVGKGGVHLSSLHMHKYSCACWWFMWWCLQAHCCDTLKLMMSIG